MKNEIRPIEMKKCISFCGFFLTFIFVINTNAAIVTIPEIPAYNWYHGCGPTAAGSIIGYYDLHGYDSLFNASGWDEVSLTSNVQDEISSPDHNVAYDPDPDVGPAPADTSIADFFHTSENQPYGWSYLSDADDAFVEYANYKGYNDWSASNKSYSNFTWGDLTSEIDAGRPMMFLVDSDGDGGTDHFVPVFGYDESNNKYGFYDTWGEDETIRWQTFQGMGNYNWGVGYATFVAPGAPDVVPEPTTIILFGFGILCIAGVSRRKNRYFFA